MHGIEYKPSKYNRGISYTCIVKNCLQVPDRQFHILKMREYGREHKFLRGDNETFKTEIQSMLSWLNVKRSINKKVEQIEFEKKVAWKRSFDKVIQEFKTLVEKASIEDNKHLEATIRNLNNKGYTPRALDIDCWTPYDKEFYCGQIIFDNKHDEVEKGWSLTDHWNTRQIGSRCKSIKYDPAMDEESSIVYAIDRILSATKDNSHIGENTIKVINDVVTALSNTLTKLRNK